MSPPGLALSPASKATPAPSLTTLDVTRVHDDEREKADSPSCDPPGHTHPTGPAGGLVPGSTLAAMTMSHRDRFKLKSQLVEELTSGAWTTEKLNLLFGEFGLEQLDDELGGPSITDVVGGASDTTLVELYAVVFDVAEVEVEDSVEAVDTGSLWKQGYIRVFLSHSAKHKEFVGEIANELAVLGVHGFVAHDTMEPTKPWQEQIERSLRSMQAFVAIIHPEFNDSAWCHQEVGWALGRRVPHYAIRVGHDPAGFLGRDQWPSGHAQSPKQIASTIYAWVASSVPELGSTIVDSLLQALSDAGNYYDAEAAAQRIVALGSLTDEDWTRLHAAYWSNDQVFGGVLPSRLLKPFYAAHGRDWPPPKPGDA